jgi:hypothetical protein
VHEQNAGVLRDIADISQQCLFVIVETGDAVPKFIAAIGAMASSDPS